MESGAPINFIPVLNRDNHEQWFRRMKLRLEGKDIFYTAETSLEAYAWTGFLSEAKFPKNGYTERPRAEKLEGKWDIEKKAEFKKDQAKSLTTLADYLIEDDQKIIDEFGTAIEVWARLKSKYQKVSVTAANKYLTQIQNFHFDENDGIEASWARIKGLRNKLTAANISMRNAYPDDGLLIVLMNKLPELYSPTIDGLHLQEHLTAEEKIKRLVDKEDRSKESANIATRRKTSSSQHRRYSDISMKDSLNDSISPSQMCFLCKGEHFQRYCPFVAEIQKFGEQLRIRQERRDTSKAQNTNKAPQY